jgi:hypothetical protein
MGIAMAPSKTVKDYLLTLRDRLEDTLPISLLDKSKTYITPFFYYFTKWHDTLFPNQQPREEVNRYGFTV